MRDNIQILSSSVLTNKSSGFITIILHILQDTRESNTVIFKIKLKNWLVNTNQDILNNDANSFNKFFLECINSEKKEDD
jgi:N-glycosylase/DNA lyase